MNGVSEKASQWRERRDRQRESVCVCMSADSQRFDRRTEGEGPRGEMVLRLREDDDDDDDEEEEAEEEEEEEEEAAEEEEKEGEMVVLLVVDNTRI